MNPFFNAKTIKKAIPASRCVHADEGNVEGREESENRVSEAHLDPSADQSVQPPKPILSVLAVTRRRRLKNPPHRSRATKRGSAGYDRDDDNRRPEEGGDIGLKLGIEPPDTLTFQPVDLCPPDFAEMLGAHKPALMALLKLPFVMVYPRRLRKPSFSARTTTPARRWSRLVPRSGAFTPRPSCGRSVSKTASRRFLPPNCARSTRSNAGSRGGSPVRNAAKYCNRQRSEGQGYVYCRLHKCLVRSRIVSASFCFWASDNLPAGTPSANRSKRSSAITSTRLERERFSKAAICSSLFRCSSRTVRLSFALFLFFWILPFAVFYTSSRHSRSRPAESDSIYAKERRRPFCS